jgi:signal transduction histidine kinase
MSTNEGLVRFDPDTGSFQRYGGESGALAQYWYDSHAYGPDGTLMFWSAEGIVAFDPALIRENTAPPAVVLTGLRLGNERVRPGPEGPLQRPLWAQPEVRLAHDQNGLTFEFVGLHFKDPARNRYAYRLEGFDEDWVQAGTQRTATYTNLPPGRYTFRVRAASSDGVWNEEGVAVGVVIAPPWWRAWWAYVLYALLLGAAVAGTLRAVRARAVRREREVARERELAQARRLEEAYRDLDASHHELKTAQDQLVHQEKMASLGRLTAGIAHEIKNPLNFVNNFAGLSQELMSELRETLAPRAQDLDGDVADLLDALDENVARIEEHGRRADSIVKSMLAHSRTSGGPRHPVRLNAVVEEYAGLAYHGLRASNPALQVRLDLDLDEAAGDVEAVTQDLGRIVLNLVNNALYAVHQAAARRGADYAPAVRVATRPLGDAVEVRVEDNGDGIPAAIRARIFEPFFTTKPSGEGTGLGLSITYDIVTAGYGGTLTVESEEGVGTTFVIRLPRAAGPGSDQSAVNERTASAADGTSPVTSTSTPASSSGR